MNLTKLKTEFESNSAAVSFNNVLKLKQTHGDIVGIIHRIDIENNHDTQIVFFDGYIHEANGFSCDNSNRKGFVGLGMLIQLIPCKGYIAIELVGYLTSYHSFPDNKINHVVIQADNGLMPEDNILSTSDGKKTLDELIKLIHNDPDSSLEDSDEFDY